MTENELREIIREQILTRFHTKKSRLVEATEKDDEVDSDVQQAVDQLKGLDASMVSLIKGSVKKDKNVKKTEQASLIAGLVIGLPGLLELLSKMAKLLAKGMNKVTKNKHFDEKKEGETFEHAAHALHKKYIGWLKPVVKIAFKKYVGKDEKKAEIYAQVLYAVLLAVVAGHALTGAGTGITHGFKEMGHFFHVAYEAAHGTHVSFEVAKIASAMKAALAAVGEAQAAREIAAAV